MVRSCDGHPHTRELRYSGRAGATGAPVTRTASASRGRPRAPNLRASGTAGTRAEPRRRHAERSISGSRPATECMGAAWLFCEKSGARMKPERFWWGWFERLGFEGIPGGGRKARLSADADG